MPEISFLIPRDVWGWRDFLKDFLSPLVSLAGFVLAVFTLWLNAFLARRSQRKLLERDRDSKRIVIIQDLLGYHRQVSNLAETISMHHADDNFHYVGLEYPTLYTRMAPTVGILPKEEVEAVASAYRWIARLSQGVEARSLPGESKFLRIGRSDYSDLSIIAKVARRDITLALQSLGAKEEADQEKQQVER